MSDYVIILAGGKGLRMGADIPKQFLPVGGKPVLMRTIERFREYSDALNIILVLPEAQQDYWRQLCKDYRFDKTIGVSSARIIDLTRNTRLRTADKRASTPLKTAFSSFPTTRKASLACTMVCAPSLLSA